MEGVECKVQGASNKVYVDLASFRVLLQKAVHF